MSYLVLANPVSHTVRNKINPTVFTTFVYSPSPTNRYPLNGDIVGNRGVRGRMHVFYILSVYRLVRP